MARRAFHLPLMIAAAVLAVACAVALLLAVSGEAEAVLPGKNGRIDLSQDVSVPKKCETGGHPYAAARKMTMRLSEPPITTRSNP
jgi:hypothetical protein